MHSALSVKRLQAHCRVQMAFGKPVKTQIANCKCGVLLRFRDHLDLPKPTLKIHDGKMRGS